MIATSCKKGEQLQKEYENLLQRYETLKNEGLKLDMSRGKPSKLQLDLVSDILTILTDPEECLVDGVDARNYGVLEGLQCAREYWADVLDCKPEQTFIGGSASLNLMFDVIAKAYSAPHDFPSLYVPVRM